jgi:hypothetical protein
VWAANKRISTKKCRDTNQRTAIEARIINTFDGRARIWAKIPDIEGFDHQVLMPIQIDHPNDLPWSNGDFLRQFRFRTRV